MASKREEDALNNDMMEGEVKKSENLCNKDEGIASVCGSPDRISESVPVVDADGKTMTLKRVSKSLGYDYIPLYFHDDILQGVPRLKLRDGDVLLSSFSKCGCHWLWDILRMLQTGTVILDTAMKESHMLEALTQADVDRLPSPRILNNHQFFHSQPTDMFNKKIQVVLMYRNIKDVLTSLWYQEKHNYDGTFQNFVRRVIDSLVPLGSPFEYFKSWEKGMREHPELPVFVCRFEDLKQNPIPVLKSLAEFIGAERTDENFLRAIMDATSFEEMRARKVMTEDVDGKKYTARMYRKGVVGDWKNIFTVAHNEWISRIIDQELKNTRFNMIYE